MQAPNFEKLKTLMPSKKFSLIIGACVLGLLLFLGITSYFGSSSRFSRSGRGSLISTEGTMHDLKTRDSNTNGIPDWEETLWGLDPNGDGPANKKTITQKKIANGVTEETPANTPTDTFSQSLLSTILALKQSDSLTPEAITNLAAGVSGSIDAKHAEVQEYILGDLTLTNKAGARDTYEKDLRAVIDQYEEVPLGAELSYIAASMQSGTSEALDNLHPIAEAYTELGQKIAALTTPTPVAQYALTLANSSIQMGTYLKQVTMLYTDALGGMVGLDDYIKASKASDEAAAKMKLYFSAS
jgi:hypothetical protein